MNASPGGAPQRSPIVETAVEGPERVGQVVVDAVAAVADEPPTELAPLYDAIDPDALDSLFPADATAGSVSFSYCGYLVVVTADGAVRVYDADDEEPSP